VLVRCSRNSYATFLSSTGIDDYFSSTFDFEGGAGRPNVCPKREFRLQHLLQTPHLDRRRSRLLLRIRNPHLLQRAQILSSQLLQLLRSPLPRIGSLQNGANRACSKFNTCPFVAQVTHEVDILIQRLPHRCHSCQISIQDTTIGELAWSCQSRFLVERYFRYLAVLTLFASAPSTKNPIRNKVGTPES
jgi:hypothetical protein